MTPVPYDSFQRYPVYSKQSHTRTHTHTHFTSMPVLWFFQFIYLGDHSPSEHKFCSFRF